MSRNLTLSPCHLAILSLLLFFTNCTTLPTAKNDPIPAAETKPAATKPPAAKTIPPAEPDAKDRLNKSPRHNEWIQIPVEGEKAMRSYIVYPERPDKAPVVLVIMEIHGMTDWLRATTDQLAADGFIAIAPDFLSDQSKNDEVVPPDQARTLIRKLTKDDVMKKLNAARDYGKKLPASNGKTATVGFCWGGTMSFNYAAAQPDLNAAVVFYGSAPAEDQLQNIKCPVAGFYGGNDARITAAVPATTDAMKKQNKKFEPHTYEAAGHGFMRAQATTDSEPNRKAAKEAWPTAIDFLTNNTK